MRLAKTEKARQALLDRRYFSARERQLLILCNGERRLQDVKDWLGDDAVHMLLDLRQRGYLAEVASFASHQQMGAVAALAHTQKSLVACKMYVLNILQMQRDVQALPLVDALHRSTNEAALLETVGSALCYLRQMANASYAQRVQKQILDLVPEQLHSVLLADAV